MKIIITFLILLISTISYADMYSCAVDKSVFTDLDICSSNCDIECSTLDINPNNAGSCDATKYDSFFLYKGNTYAITKNAIEFESDNNLKIVDEKHNNIIKSILQKKGIAHAWIGASDKDMSTQYDRINKSRFTWGDRTKLGYSNFDKTEPDNKFMNESIGVSPVYGEHFLVMDDKGLWFDVGYNLDGTEKILPSIVSFSGVMDCVAGDEIEVESNTSDLLCPDGSDDCMTCVKGLTDTNDTRVIGQCSYGNNFTHTSNGIEMNVSDKFLCSIDRDDPCAKEQVGIYYEDVVKDYDLSLAHKSNSDFNYEHNDTNGIYVINDGEGIVTSEAAYSKLIIFDGLWNARYEHHTENYSSIVVPKLDPELESLEGTVKYQLVVNDPEQHILKFTTYNYDVWTEYEDTLCDSSSWTVSDNYNNYNYNNCTDAELEEIYGNQYLNAMIAKKEYYSCITEAGIEYVYTYVTSHNIKSVADLKNYGCDPYFKYENIASGERLFNKGQKYRYTSRHISHKIPITLRVSYRLKKIDYKYSCSSTIGINQPCIQATDSKYYCSPYNCYDASDEDNIIDTDTDTGITDPDNNGGLDDNGTCLGVISVFGGAESRCREVALFDTGFAQCCDVLSIEQQREDTFARKYQMSACTAEEKGLMANRYGDKCVEVGELYCTEYFAGSCTNEKRTFCCFEDDFQRAFTEAGKDLLGRSWGISQFPDCSGFTVEELQKLGAMGISDHPKMREYAEKFGDEFTDKMMDQFNGTVTEEIPNIEEDILNQIGGMK